MTTHIQPTLFDYAGLDSETRIVIQQEDKEFDQHIQDAGSNFLRACHNLARIHAALRYKRPGFVEYCASKPGLSRTTAQRMVDVARMLPNLGNISAAPSALYLLAAPSTPDDLRSAFITQASNGGAVTHGMVKTALRDYAAEEHDASPLPFEPAPSAYDATPPPWTTYQGGWDEDDDEVLPPSEPDLWTCDICDHRWPMTRPDCWNCHQGINPHVVIAEPVAGDYDGDEWYTPDEWLIAARALYGGVIDLDPASCTAAQLRVQATTYYAKADNGLERPWIGNVWCNPPYSTKLVQAFTARAHAEYSAGSATAILLLVNNCTDTQWFSTLASMYPVMFSRGRADFWRPDQTSFNTRQGQALFYLGPNVQRFYETFAELAYAPNWRIV